MYLERIQKLKPSILLYWPIPLSFIFLMLVNFVLSSQVDTTEIMQQSIATLGVNITFLSLIAPLALGFLMVLVWTKFIHRIPLTIFISGRDKIDWNRILFSFSIWAGFTILTTIWAYYSVPENFVWNFKLERFMISFSWL